MGREKKNEMGRNHLVGERERLHPPARGCRESECINPKRRSEPSRDGEI